MFKVENNSEYAEMMKAYIDNGADGVEKLEGQVSAGGAGGFEAGDHIDWPDKLEPIKVKLREDSKPQQAFLVQITNKTGVKRYQLFFPSTLGKSIRKVIVNEKGEVVKEEGFVRTQGTAAQDYQNHANLNIDDVIRGMMKDHPNGMDCDEVDKVWTYRFNTKEPAQSNLYTLNYTA